jgi:hypothetical protein
MVPVDGPGVNHHLMARAVSRSSSRPRHRCPTSPPSTAYRYFVTRPGDTRNPRPCDCRACSFPCPSLHRARRTPMPLKGMGFPDSLSGTRKPDLSGGDPLLPYGAPIYCCYSTSYPQGWLCISFSSAPPASGRWRDHARSQPRLCAEVGACGEPPAVPIETRPSSGFASRRPCAGARGQGLGSGSAGWSSAAW